MQITSAILKPTFANHESFHLRYGWLKKAYNQVIQDDQIFLREDAPVKLGVGKNMVRAIKFWGIANKIIQSNGTARNSKMIPTDMGYAIFNDETGIDPYLEKPDTLWLLHWLLYAPPCNVPVWWIVMNEIAATSIKLEDVTESAIARITNISQWNTPSPKSIKKDIDVFIHTYTTRQDKLSIEDYLDCPFRQLHMIKQNSKDAMRFVFGKKYGLSPRLVAFACLDFIHRSEIKAKSVSTSRLATEAGSIGNVFKINENDLIDLLKDACDDTISMQNVNGAQHLRFDDPKSASMDILAKLYGIKKIPKPKLDMISH